MNEQAQRPGQAPPPGALQQRLRAFRRSLLVLGWFGVPAYLVTLSDTSGHLAVIRLVGLVASLGAFIGLIAWVFVSLTRPRPSSSLVVVALLLSACGLGLDLVVGAQQSTAAHLPPVEAIVGLYLTAMGVVATWQSFRSATCASPPAPHAQTGSWT